MSASWRPPGVRPSPGQRGPGGQPLASGKSLDPPVDGRLVGRGPHLARIDRLLRTAREGRTGALVLVGDSGVGKTALLRAAAERAEGFTVLSTHGVESESTLAHACLLDLLSPLRSRLGDVPPGQAAALSQALGWSRPDGPGDRFLVSAGTLALLAAAAASSPLLLVVDDVQWVDAESTAPLLFAARRMHHDRVVLLFARRPESAPAIGGIDALQVDDLSIGETEALLAPAVSAPVARQLVAGLGGNPLALLEVAARLRPPERRGEAPLPHPLPVGGLAELFAPRLHALSAGARRALLLLAAAAEGRTSHIAAALELTGVAAAAALDEVERERVVVRDGDGLAFRHPLIRTATWRLADPEDRRSAHRALADTALAGDDVSRTWHLAQAVDGRDDALADALVAVAGRAREQRGFAASSTALERAASLTTDAGRASTLLAAAVDDAAVGGDVERVRTLAARVLGGAAGAAARARTLHVLGVLEQHTGSVPAARGLLREAADAAEGGQRTWALADLALTQHVLGDVVGLVETAEEIARDLDAAAPDRAALAGWVTGAAAVLAGDPEAGRTGMGRALARMEAEPVLRDDPRFLVLFILGHGWMDDALAAFPGIERRLRTARERGALGLLVSSLAMVAHGRAQLLGDHVGAFADAGEAVDLAEHLGYVADAAPAVEMLAWEYAARGRHDLATEHVERARSLVVRARTTAVAAHLAVTEAFCALCRGDLEATVTLLEARLTVDGGVGPIGEPLGVAPLLVEAYAGLGRDAEAGVLAARYAEASLSPTPATAALVARCRALATADPDEARAAFEEALVHHSRSPDGFELAHTRLLYGARLRRWGRRVEARGQLEIAADRFAAMDLGHWAQRADSELQATGRSARPRRPLPVEPLTPQETQVAGLAASGLSNRDIAATLFLSPKTVEHHLSGVYRKRGLRSRVQLAHVFPPT